MGFFLLTFALSWSGFSTLAILARSAPVGVADYALLLLGVSPASSYTWKKQYAGLGIAELRELRQLREENGRLKRLVAYLTLDRQILQKALTKKV
jgi:transposase